MLTIQQQIRRQIMSCRKSLSTVIVLLLLAAAARAQQVNLPKEFVKDCEYFLGDWATEAEIDGTVYHSTWTARWSPDKSCLVTHWAADTPDGPARGTRIQGWDALTKKMLVVDFSPNGASSIERYEIVSDEVDEGEITRVDAQGKPHKATARTLRRSPDFFTWTVTEDGKAVPHKFRRVKN
jgi:hypothetical protein